jgi:hypothetical protein
MSCAMRDFGASLLYVVMNDAAMRSNDMMHESGA